MPNTIYYSKTALTGGGATALDYIDGALLADGDISFVFVSGVLYVYKLNATSGAAESSPAIISPDTNAGDKRWILQAASPAYPGAGIPVSTGSAWGTSKSAEQVVDGWIQFNGTGTIAILDSFNVSGITDEGTGDYTVTWDTDFANDDYACVVNHEQSPGAAVGVAGVKHGTFATGSVRILTYAAGPTLYDYSTISVIAIGDQ